MTRRSLPGLWSRATGAAFGSRTSPIRTAGHDFTAGEHVRSLGRVKNDGTYAHRGIGEIVVHEDDLGVVHEKWNFLGQIYYTVEFIDRAVVVIMRGAELAKVDH
ncbi:MAG: nitrogen fixation protein NifZ [Bradyrhizobiaceae bacterium]|nr:nitrogen fixation protein NifZ [Bradyrhizobiaceae bacterium]